VPLFNGPVRRGQRLMINLCHTVLKGKPQRLYWAGEIAKDAGGLLFAIGRVDGELGGIHPVVFGKSRRNDESVIAHFGPLHDAIPSERYGSCHMLNIRRRTLRSPELWSLVSG